VIVLAGVAGLRAYADAAYRQGLGFTDRPAEDVPGRLASYEEALTRSPRCFTYLLRSGQIHLGRAAAGGDDRASNLRLAGERIRDAVDVHPLDPRGHVALAGVLRLEGDTGAALAALKRALAVGPRHPGVQARAIAVAVDVWARGGGLDALRFALDTASLRRAWLVDAPVPGDVVASLRTRGEGAVGDLLEACGGDPARLAVAVAWTERALPGIAPAIRAVERRVGRER
jgi:hypothetical protein